MLFRQTRVGKDGVDFELLKLRSMVVNAERQGAGFAVDRGDARITRVGRSEAEVERVRSAYSASDPGTRLDLHGRYVALWHREPSPTQRQVTYDCAY